MTFVFDIASIEPMGIEMIAATTQACEDENPFFRTVGQIVAYARTITPPTNIPEFSLETRPLTTSQLEKAFVGFTLLVDVTGRCGLPNAAAFCAALIQAVVDEKLNRMNPTRTAPHLN